MNKILKGVAAAIFWLLVWQVAALIVHNKILLVGPVETANSLVRMTGESEFWQSICTSYTHIMLGILIGTVFGVGLGILAYRVKIAEVFLSPLVTAMKAVPVASFIILILIWIGSGNVSIFISALVVFPILYTAMTNGLMAADARLLEMAKVYRMPGLNTFRYIYFPKLLPFLHGALSLAIPMGFKSGVAAEVIGQPLGSMGNGLYRAKIYLDTGDLFAWTVVIVAVSYITEKVILWLLALFNKNK